MDASEASLRDMLATTSNLLVLALTQYTIAFNVVVFVLVPWSIWRIWRFTLVPLLYPDCPRELPYYIPILGHGPAFFQSSDALLAKASKYFTTREPFAVTLFGSTLYIVTDPQHTVEVYKNDTTLSFDEFAQDLVRTNGYSEAAVLASYTKLPVDKPGFPNPSGAAFGTYVRQMHMRQLYPGTDLLALERQFLAWYDQNLTESAIQESCSLYGLSARRDMGDFTAPAMEWCSNYATRAGEVSYFGDALGFIDPNLASAFLEFDDLSWQVLYRYPALLSGKMRAARLQMMHAFTAYLRLPQAQRTGSAWLLNAMEDEARQIGVADEDIAVLYFNVYWLISTNTRKIAFWMLAFLLHRAHDLIQLIRAETAPAFQGQTLVDLSYLYDSCPILDSVWHESLRLCSNAASVRFIQHDTIVGGKRMRQGNRIMIPYRLLHFDERIYGPRPCEFRPERFHASPLKPGSVPTVKDPTRGPSWRPFGGGKSLCTGRYIAKRSTLIFIAILLRRFDIDLAGTSQLPAADLGRPVLGISGIKDEDDFWIRFRPRE